MLFGGESAVSLAFRVVLVTHALLQLDHVSGTTYLPVCETRKSAAKNSEDNWKHSSVERTDCGASCLFIAAPYKYSYLLTYIKIPLPGTLATLNVPRFFHPLFHSRSTTRRQWLADQILGSWRLVAAMTRCCQRSVRVVPPHTHMRARPPSFTVRSRDNGATSCFTRHRVSAVLKTRPTLSYTARPDFCRA